MKKNVTCGNKVALVLAGVLFAGTVGMAPLAMAKQGGGYVGPSASGGYTGPGPVVMTIKEAGNQPDDSWVTFRGNIVNHKGDEKYTFQDASGTGVVEIDRKAWRGYRVGPNDVVELLVEVDKDWGSVEFDVKSVTPVSK